MDTKIGCQVRRNKTSRARSQVTFAAHDNAYRMLEISHLTRRFGALTAVDDISFSVAPGEVLGFLGPNGAGKSTTMKMITGFLAPTSGTARVCGHDVETDGLAARRSIGYLPEGAPGYAEMTVRGFLEFIADMRGLAGGARRAPARRRRRAARARAVCSHQVIETLSKGFRRRVGLAQAILHDPPVLILDEPTDGLDPNQKHEVRRLIRDVSKDKIIVISTHILEEVDAVCTRAIIIAGGRLLADDTPQGLEARSRWHGAVTLALDEPVALEVVRARLLGLPEVAAAEATGPQAVTAFARDGTGGAARGRARWPRAKAGSCASCVRRPAASTRCSAASPTGARGGRGRCVTWRSCSARELASYFATPLALVFIVIFLVLAGALAFYLGGFYERGQADLAPFFNFHPWLYLFLIPALSMRLWAEERKSGSIELLMTLPVTPVAGGARQIPRRLVRRGARARAHLPDLDHGQLPGRPRQRRDPRRLRRAAC